MNIRIGTIIMAVTCLVYLGIALLYGYNGFGTMVIPGKTDAKLFISNALSDGDGTPSLPQW